MVIHSDALFDRQFVSRVRLAAALSDVDEEEIVAEFKQIRRGRKAAAAR